MVGCSLAIILWGGCSSRVDIDEQVTAKPNRSDPLNQAQLAISRQQWDEADKLLRQSLLLEPENQSVQRMLASVAANRRDWDLATDLMSTLVQGNVDASLEDRNRLAAMYMSAGRPFESMRVQKQTIEQFPDAIQKRSDLTGLATVMGTEEVAIEQLRWLARHNLGEEEGLAVLAQPSQVQPDVALCEKALSVCPEDQRAQFGIAKVDAMNSRWAEVAQRLRAVLERHPDFVPAYALYGRAVIELDDSNQIHEWRQNRPDGAQSSPLFWLTTGIMLQEQGQNEAAAKAFLEAATRHDGNDSQTLTYLIGVLRRIDRIEAAKQVEARNELLARLHDTVKTLHERETRSQSAAMAVARVMVDLGRW
ncbi:tetratricopeptide repeat protein [Neorhodopirellula pilleata]|uniref:tetratricopeptide repeat protein n=1 Tax=Neorhodopirellula pilleata TaxID=2714738 RepID=UPI0011B7B5EC|nr:tetratricopeptide repeat protein [Neorhodopirellula pilleata]